jgi:hypothetical protein
MSKLAWDTFINATVKSDDIKTLAETLDISYAEAERRVKKIAKASSQSRAWREKETAKMNEVKALLAKR